MTPERFKLQSQYMDNNPDAETDATSAVVPTKGFGEVTELETEEAPTVPKVEEKEVQKPHGGGEGFFAPKLAVEEEPEDRKSIDFQDHEPERGPNWGKNLPRRAGKPAAPIEPFKLKKSEVKRVDDPESWDIKNLDQPKEVSQQ